MNILFVGGNFEKGKTGKGSNLFLRLVCGLLSTYRKTIGCVHIVNGGTYEGLVELAENRSLIDLNEIDVTFWFANIPDNSLPKVRDLKSVNPRMLLVASKRNDNNKYSFQELIQRALSQKANLLVEFSKKGDKLFNIMTMDPLGCVWTDTTDIHEASEAIMSRLEYLLSVTRQPTAQGEFPSELDGILNEQPFVDLVKKYAHKFQEYMPKTCETTRFVGNASYRAKPPQVGRCGKGFPSFRHGDFIFVSKRNIDKQFIELENFVPVFIKDNKIYYRGNDKPSVDTPVQVRLYQVLPNINYMLHSHCYIEGAPFTKTAVPCGAIEECAEVLGVIDDNFGTRDSSFYCINLLGHGSIVMANNIEQFNDIPYIARDLPEVVKGDCDEQQV